VIAAGGSSENLIVGLRSTRPVERVLIALGAALVIATAGAAVLAGGDEPTEATAGPAEMTDTVTIDDFEFMPPEAAVAAGTEVAVDNVDDVGHTLSSEDGGLFDSGGIDAGDSTTVTVDEPGEYPYICEFHPSMHGTLTVE